MRGDRGGLTETQFSLNERSLNCDMEMLYTGLHDVIITSHSKVTNEEVERFEAPVVRAGGLVLISQSELPPLLQVQSPHLPDQRTRALGY